VLYSDSTGDTVAFPQVADCGIGIGIGIGTSVCLEDKHVLSRRVFRTSAVVQGLWYLVLLFSEKVLGREPLWTDALEGKRRASYSTLGA